MDNALEIMRLVLNEIIEDQSGVMDDYMHIVAPDASDKEWERTAEYLYILANEILEENL